MSCEFFLRLAVNFHLILENVISFDSKWWYNIFLSHCILSFWRLDTLLMLMSFSFGYPALGIQQLETGKCNFVLEGSCDNWIGN